MAGFEAAAGGGTPGGAGSKHHRARQQSLGGGSRPEETVEAMCRPRAPLLRALGRLAAPFLTPVPASGRTLNMCSGSFMVGQMAVNFSEETHVSVEYDDLIDITPDFPSVVGTGMSSFFKELLSQKSLPVEDLTSFCGDYDYPANTEMLDRGWDDASSIIKYELALSRIEYEIVRNGMRGVFGPSRLLLRRLFYRQNVERDVLELRKRFGDMENLFQRLEGSTAKGFEELRQCFKQLSLENKKIIDDGLAEIEKASKKDQAALDAAFDEMKAKLSSFEEQFAPFVKDLEKASKSGEGSFFQRLKVEMLLRNASYVSAILYRVVCFIRDGKPDPGPAPPAPAPLAPSPSPSPVEEDEEVPLVEPPPSRPTSQHFYKSIGRQNKSLLQKDFALAPSLGCKFKVPVGPDDKTNVSVIACTGDKKVACKVSCAGLLEDKARMTFTSGLDGFKPKAKVFYAFPFAGVNGHLNASVLYGASPDLKFALTLEKLGIVAGGKVLFDTLTKRMKHHEFGASYGPGSVKLVDGDKLKLSLYQGCLSQGVAGGIELTYSRTKDEAAVCGAVKVRVSDATQVKAKVESRGAVTAAVQHCLGVGLDVGACVRVSPGEAARYGFSLKSRE